MVEAARLAGVDGRAAVDFGGRAAKHVRLRRPLDVVADEEIAPAIAVIVHPGRRGGPSDILDSAAVRHVHESTTSLAIGNVLKQPAAPNGSYEQVIEIIVIMVADRHAHPLHRHVEPGRLGYISEGSIMVIAVEG